MRRLYNRLRAVGYKPWMDKVDLPKGADFAKAIPKVLRESDLFIVCLSTRSVEKRSFIQREINLALDAWEQKLEDDLYIFPVRLEACKAPDRISKFNWTDLFGDEEEEEWEALLQALRRQAERLGKASSPPSQAETETEKSSLTPFKFTTVTLAQRGKEIKRQELQTKQFIEDLGNNIKLELVEIPGGPFTMGALKLEVQSYDSERPQHKVTISPFFMGKFTITQEQWRVIAADKSLKVARDLELDPAHFKGANRPVEQVSWEEAAEFCARLAKKTGRTYRLPTEAEWEYACRAGTTTPFAFGATITPEIVNYGGNYPYADAPKGEYRSETIPVGSLGVANAFGLFDLHGNVLEWCQDWYGEYKAEDQTDPTGPRDGQYRVLRGGSWYAYGGSCRAAYRGGYAPADRGNDLGFRCVIAARAL